MKRTISICLFALATMIVGIGCSSVGITGPEDVAKDTFARWAEINARPYRDVTYTKLKDDGTFATVRVTAWMRETAQSNWLEYQADLEIRKVGGKWQTTSSLFFALTPAEQARQKVQGEATATAQRAIWEAKTKLLDSIDITNAKRVRDSRKFGDVPVEVIAPNIAKVVLEVRNPDSKDHQVRIRFYLGLKGWSGLYPADPGPSEVTISAKAGGQTKREFQVELSGGWFANAIKPGAPIICIAEILDAD